jgi:hypothetical protein
VWLVRVADAEAGGGYRQATLGKADDALKAAGTAVLDYYQAEGAARAWVAGHHRRKAGADYKAASCADVAYTVADAARDYLADYTARGGKGVPHTRAAIDAHVMPSLGGPDSQPTVAGPDQGLASGISRATSAPADWGRGETEAPGYAC